MVIGCSSFARADDWLFVFCMQALRQLRLEVRQALSSLAVSLLLVLLFHKLFLDVPKTCDRGASSPQVGPSFLPPTIYFQLFEVLQGIPHGG